MVERIELLEEQWAEVRPHMTVPMQQAFNAFVKIWQGLPEPERDESEELDGALRELIVASVKTWSFGAVSMDVCVNEVPVEDQIKLAQTAQEVVLKSPLVSRSTQNGVHGSQPSSSASSGGAASRKNSRLRTSAMSQAGVRTS